MNYINECFEEHRPAFVEKLTEAGFSYEHARQFISETASGITKTMKSPDANKTVTNLQQNLLSY